MHAHVNFSQMFVLSTSRSTAQHIIMLLLVLLLLCCSCAAACDVYYQSLCMGDSNCRHDLNL
jgi:hypothetical protein